MLCPTCTPGRLTPEAVNPSAGECPSCEKQQISLPGDTLCLACSAQQTKCQQCGKPVPSPEPAPEPPRAST